MLIIIPSILHVVCSNSVVRYNYYDIILILVVFYETIGPGLSNHCMVEVVEMTMAGIM